MGRPKKKTLLELRNERNIKQKEIMDLMGINRKTLYNWEHCVTAPDHWQLQALCKFYAVKKGSVIIAPRYDPYAFLPDDKTYEEYLQDKADWARKNLPSWLW